MIAKTVHTSVLPLISIGLSVFAFVATTVLWSEGLAIFDPLSFVAGCIAFALLFAGHHLFTHPGAHP